MITMAHSIHGAVTRDEVIVRAFNSITSEQASIIAGIAWTSGQGWDVQVVDDYDGYRFVLIENARHDDEQKNFIVAGTAHCLELFDAQDDRMALIGTFTNIEALGVRLTALVGLQ